MKPSTQRQAFGLKILNAKHHAVRKLKAQGHQAEIHGNKFWNSSFLIMDHLKRHPPKQGLRVLDIGCGWGLLGLYCAKQFNARVTGIDADKNVGPYLQLHATTNRLAMSFETRSFDQLTKAYLANFDLIVGADICFWDELAHTVFKLIKRAHTAGVGQIIIADPCRTPFEVLVDKSERAFDQVERIDARLKRPVKATGDLLIVSQD